MLADANTGAVDSFDDSLASDLADQFDLDAMADDDNMGPRVPTGTDPLSLPSGSAQSYGPEATNFAAAQYNSDFSVANQSVVSSDQRSVTINQGLTLQEAGALVEHHVGQNLAMADAAFQNLWAESSSALTASAQETRAAQLRAESSQREAEEKILRAADREAELSRESHKLIERADLKVTEAQEETKRAKADAERRFTALAREAEGRIKEAEERSQAAEEKAKKWAEQRIEEERRRAQFDASAELKATKEELARQVEGLRRLQVDHDSQSKDLRENADRARDSAVRRAREEIEKGETITREVQNLQRSGDTMRKSLQDLHEKVSGLNKIIKDLKAENEDLKSRLQLASKGVPPLPGRSSRGSSPSPESFELKIGKIVEERINTAL